MEFVCIVARFLRSVLWHIDSYLHLSSDLGANFKNTSKNHVAMNACLPQASHPYVIGITGLRRTSCSFSGVKKVTSKGPMVIFLTPPNEQFSYWKQFISLNVVIDFLWNISHGINVKARPHGPRRAGPLVWGFPHWENRRRGAQGDRRQTRRGGWQEPGNKRNSLSKKFSQRDYIWCWLVWIHIFLQRFGAL